ncbi:MAG: hypothetical protein CFE44_20080 [Burkholderiales bacterium PBB4]|nr:MAG: hypothetical protein CFE44_20080 [Burkholderiales bacterium PBB4]
MGGFFNSARLPALDISDAGSLWLKEADMGKTTAQTSGRDRTTDNRKAYIGEKSKKDRVLLRLEKGEAARLDAACGSHGLSRSAFFSRHVLPKLESLAGRPCQPASAPDNSVPPPEAVVASEFDQLFGPGE